MGQKQSNGKPEKQSINRQLFAGTEHCRFLTPLAYIAAPVNSDPDCSPHLQNRLLHTVLPTTDACIWKNNPQISRTVCWASWPGKDKECLWLHCMWPWHERLGRKMYWLTIHRGFKRYNPGRWRWVEFRCVFPRGWFQRRPHSSAIPEERFRWRLCPCD